MIVEESTKRLEPFANRLIRFCVAAGIVHAVILLGIMPRLSRQLAPLYNQSVFADGYDQLATNLVDGYGYRFYRDTAPTLLREPGYPMLLASLFRLFGTTFTVVTVTNMVMVLATAMLVAAICRRVSDDGRFIVAAPLLFMFHPGILIAESRGGPEAVFMLFLTLFVLMVYVALRTEKASAYGFAGAILGVVVLIKSTPIACPILLFAYLAATRRQRLLIVVRNIGSMLAAMLVVMSPWIIRNYVVTKRFVPTASIVGVSAHAGQYICMNLDRDKQLVAVDRQAAQERMALATEMGYPFKHVETGYYQLFYSSVDEVRFSSDLLKRVADEYRSRPALFAKCVGLNLFNLWFAGKTWRSTGLNIVVQLPYLVLAFYGIVVSLRDDRGRRIAPLLLILISYVAVHVAILAQARYSVPLIPFISILAVVPFRERLARHPV